MTTTDPFAADRLVCEKATAGPRRGDVIVEQVRLLIADIASPGVTKEQFRASVGTEADQRWPEYSQ